MSTDPKTPLDPTTPPAPQPPPKKKRRFSRLTIILGIILLLFACGAFASIFNGGGDEEPTAEVAEDAEQPAAIDEPAEATEVPTEEPAPTGTTEPTAAPTDTPEPVATLSPDQALRAAVNAALGDSNRDVERLVRVEDDAGRIEIDWAINDNLTENLTQGGAQLDATNILRAVAESGYEYEFILMRGTFPLVDQLGNVEETKVVELFFSRELVDQINLDNFDHRNVYDIADSAEIHPAFVRE